MSVSSNTNILQFSGSMLSEYCVVNGTGIAQLVQCSPAEKLDTMLMQLWIPRAARIFLSQSATSADSLTVFAQPMCAVTCLNISVHVKHPKHLQPCCMLGDIKILHIPIWRGSAALAAAVPYPNFPQGIMKYSGNYKNKKTKINNGSVKQMAFEVNQMPEEF